MFISKTTSSERLRAALALMLLSCWGGCAQAPPPLLPPSTPTDQLDAPQSALIEQRRKAVLESPESAGAWGGLGQVLNAIDYDAEAGVCYRRASELEPRSVRWHHLLALTQLRTHPDEAISRLRTAANLAGNDPDISRVRLARVLVEYGRHDEAVVELNRLLAANPYHAAARLELARVQLFRNQLAEAATALEPCLTNSHTSRPALLILAQVRGRQGNTLEATALVEKAGNLPPPFDWPDPFVREVLRLRTDRIKLQDRVNDLLLNGRFVEAEKALGQLLTTYPQDPDTLLLLGRLRFQQRRCPEAEMALRAHLNAGRQSLNGLVQLALALLCQERWTDASAVLRQAIAIKPDFADGHYNLGHALSRAGDSNGAMAAYEEALRCRPGDASTHAALADEFFRANRTEEGESHLERSLKSDPNHARALRLRERYPKP